MPVDPSELDAAFTAMEAAMTREETAGGTVIVALGKQKEAIMAAVDADNTIDRANNARFKTIVEAVNARLTANAAALEAAAAANVA